MSYRICLRFLLFWSVFVWTFSTSFFRDSIWVRCSVSMTSGYFTSVCWMISNSLRTCPSIGVSRCFDCSSIALSHCSTKSSIRFIKIMSWCSMSSLSSESKKSLKNSSEISNTSSMTWSIISSTMPCFSIASQRILVAFTISMRLPSSVPQFSIYIFFSQNNTRFTRSL